MNQRTSRWPHRHHTRYYYYYYCTDGKPGWLVWSKVTAHPVSVTANTCTMSRGSAMKAPPFAPPPLPCNTHSILSFFFVAAVDHRQGDSDSIKCYYCCFVVQRVGYRSSSSSSGMDRLWLAVKKRKGVPLPSFVQQLL